MQQLQPNTLLQGGKYKIERVLGQGSFGVTYLAEHTSLGKKVCIKEFFMKELNTRKENGSITAMSQGTLSYNYAQKFRKEAMNMARMEHPNIVRVTDSFEENGTYYYVMDYIDGQNLNDYIKLCPMSVDEATSTIKKVAEALIYMHDTMHMLHLDLKPGNVMRRKDGHIFLIDFGLSKHYDANGAPETSTTIGLGTAGYAPIEQANLAKSGEFRPTIDVYALGATYYKLLTGKTPPVASELVSDPDIIEDNLREANIPQGIASIVINAMMPSVKKRTQDINAFLSSFYNKQGGHSKMPPNAADYREEIHDNPKEHDDEETQYIEFSNNNSSAEFVSALSYYNNGQYNKAFPLLLQLANKGNVDAMYRLGVCYYWDEGIERSNPKSINFSKCMQWMSKAANLGNSNAMLWIGSYLYSNGEGTAKDDNKVIEYTSRAVDAGNHSAEITLGTYYLSGQYVEVDEKKGSQLIHQGFVGLLKNASFMSREDMHMFAMCYHYGLGTEENVQKAIQWYKKSSELGNPEAQNYLGEIYLNGCDSVPENEVEALKLFKLSAKKNLTSALKNVGNCYYYGWGTSQNIKEAIKWYNKAADEGCDESMVMMGQCYRNGNGVERNYKKAEEFFLKAKNKADNINAANYLGVLYDEGGFGIVKDHSKAVRFYKQAATQGLAAAQYNYGISLINGEGTPTNVDEGLEWVKKAADQDLQAAVDFLNSFDEDAEDSFSDAPTYSSSSNTGPSITSTPTDGHGFFVNNEYVNTNNNDINLNTLNGWGTRLKGHYREAESTYVAYEFFCAFWLPIIPIGCYRVKDDGEDSYLVYGSTEWHASEVLMEYIKWWGLGIAVIVIFNMLSNK